MLVEGGGKRLTERGYDQLRRACRTHREELVVRLAGEAGLRAGEIARLRPSDVTGRDGESEMQYFVSVREADGENRTAYLPAAVAHEFWQYVRSNTIDSNQRVIDVTERRVQMLIKEVSRRAATRTSRAALESVTATTLRQFFAQQLLVEDGFDPRVVAAVGGWEGIDDLLEPLSTPSKTEIGDTFERTTSKSTGSSGRLRAVVGTIDRAVESIAEANSRSQIEQEVCQALTADRYRAAWVLDRDRKRNRPVVRTHAGESADRFDGAANSDIVKRTLQTGQPFVAPDDPGPTSEQEGRGLLAAIPLAHGETEYGVLVVRANTDDAFDDPERTALATLGREIGLAITDVERKQVLLGGSVLEVEFRYDDSEAPLVDLGETLGCSINLDGAVPSDNGFLCFLRVAGTPAKAALEAATAVQGIENARLIRSDDEGGLLEIDLATASPLLLVTERGGTVTELAVEAGEATLACEFAPETDLRATHDELYDRFGAELRSKQERQTAAESTVSSEPLEQQLTEKQRAVIRTAYHAGYFEWPRGSTAEDLAESMGISSPTLHNHLRRAQQNILGEILDTG